MQKKNKITGIFVIVVLILTGLNVISNLYLTDRFIIYYAYIADRDGCLKIIDVTAPTSPIIVGEFKDGKETKDLFVSGNYVYITEGIYGLKIIDLLHRS